MSFAPAGGDGGGGTPEGSTGDSSVDGGTDSSTPDAPPIDGTSEKPDTGACIDPCDCDKDGARARDAGCGGNDCDDTDPRANPGANFSKELATKDTKGDWNCNGAVERSIQNVNVSCGGTTGSCPDGKEGLRSDIPCGTFGEYVVCKRNPVLGCDEVDSGTAQQECR